MRAADGLAKDRHLDVDRDVGNHASVEVRLTRQPDLEIEMRRTHPVIVAPGQHADRRLGSLWKGDGTLKRETVDLDPDHRVGQVPQRGLLDGSTELVLVDGTRQGGRDAKSQEGQSDEGE
jgi:hypothetical protein